MSPEENYLSRRGLLKGLLGGVTATFLPQIPLESRSKNLPTSTEAQPNNETDKTLMELRQISDLLNRLAATEPIYEVNELTAETLKLEIEKWWQEIKLPILENSFIDREYSLLDNLRLFRSTNYDGSVDQESCEVVRVGAPIVGEIPAELSSETAGKNNAPVIGYEGVFRIPYVLAHELGHVAQQNICSDPPDSFISWDSHGHFESSAQIFALEVMADALTQRKEVVFDSRLKFDVWLRNMQITAAKAYLYARFEREKLSEIPQDWIMQAEESDREWLEDLAVEIKQYFIDDDSYSLYTVKHHDYNTLRLILTAIRSGQTYVDGLDFPGARVSIVKFSQALAGIGFDNSSSDYEDELTPQNTQKGL